MHSTDPRPTGRGSLLWPGCDGRGIGWPKSEVHEQVWSPEHIADALASALEQRERELRDEHAVYGLDALVEVDVHPLLVAGLARAGYGVLREQAYPHEWRGKRRSGGRSDLPEHRDRRRCDLVLTPQPGQVLDDALVNERRRMREIEETRGSLFEGLAAGLAGPPQDPRRVPPEEAFWLEVKTVQQFCVTSGVPGPNGAYASELTRNPVKDLAKLVADERVCHAGVCVVLCAADEATARHDLAVLAHRCLDRNLPITSPEIRVHRMQDRIGNGVCAVGLVSIAGRVRV